MKVVVMYDGHGGTPSGGGRQLYRLVDVLNGNGIEACLVHKERGFRSLWFKNDTRVMGLQDVEMRADDILVLPETMLDVFSERGMDKCRRAIYVQNPQNVFMRKIDAFDDLRRPYESAAGVLCQSEWTEEVVRHFFPGAKVYPVRYSFDKGPFSYCGDKAKAVAYMPRKCQAMAESAIWLMARGPTLTDGWKLVPVDGKSEEDTAEILRHAAVFMTLGYMEGFGMPAAEAMACGCAVVGFPGFAGEEFMRPEFCWPVREQDVLALTMALENVMKLGASELKAKGKMASDYVRSAYSTEKEVAGIMAAFGAMTGSSVEIAEKKEEKMEVLKAEWKGKKRIKAVIMSHDAPENVDRLYDALFPVFDDVEVFDSGSSPDKVPRRMTRSFPNIYWTGLWDEVRKTCRDYDAVWVLGGDVELRSRPEEYRVAMESALPFGCWSPAITGRAKPCMQVEAFKGGLRTVWNIEGMAMAASGEMLRAMGEFPKGNEIGMGQDLWMCWKARWLDMRNVVDGRVKLFHPEGTGYDMTEAGKQMEDTYTKLFGKDWRRDAFHYSDFFEENVMDWPGGASANKDFVVATVENGWGLVDFRRILDKMPGARGVVVTKGLLSLPGDDKVRAVPYEKLDEVMKEADAFLFTKVGEANKVEYEKVLKAGIPVVVHKSFDQGLVKEHQADGFVYLDESWALKWLSLLRDEPSKRKEIEARWKQPETVGKSVVVEAGPKVSVITPTYKRDPKVLFRCLSCMKLQTETSWEQVVCSDGGEEREARSVVESMQDPRMRYIFTNGKKDGDFGNTVRKTVLERDAKGKYVLFFDDDNVILPHYLERMVRALEENPEAGFAVAKILHFGPLNESAGRPPKVLTGEPVKLYHVDPLQVLVRREAMLKIGWDTQVGYLSDGVTLERLGNEFKHVAVDEVLGVHI